MKTNYQHPSLFSRCFRSTRGIAGSVAALASTLWLTSLSSPGAEVKDIMSEIEGDTECIQSAKRYYFTWMDYNDTMADLLRRGEPYDRESMKWEADRERRTSWRQPEHRPRSISVATGRVDGEENTRFGAIPSGADIAVGYLLDWSVHDIYGWGSDHQPRVESVTEIVIKPEYSARIEFTNDIQMIATGNISGTESAVHPWPQQGEHDAALTAVDINGQQHRLNVAARATAMPTRSRSSSHSQSTETKWTVSGGVSASSGGPSANIGGSYEETQKVESTRSEAESVPTIPTATYNKDYTGNTTKTVLIECGGTAKVSRAVQINGHFYTKSFARGGSVSTSATHGVTNGLKIVVTCLPCHDPIGDPDGEDPEDPTGDPDDENNNPSGPITPSSGYGSTEPEYFAPRKRGGVVVTPVQGGASDPGAFWNDPIIQGGGCIYIDPRYLPPFVVPVDEGLLSDPDFDFFENMPLGENQIPFVVPGHAGQEGEGDDIQPLAPFAYLWPEAVIEPAPDTAVIIDPSTHIVSISGQFQVVLPGQPEVVSFAGNSQIRFQPGQHLRINGPYEILAPEGQELRVLEQHGIRLHQFLLPNAVDPSLEPSLHGEVIEDQSHPGLVLFSDSADGFGRSALVLPELKISAESVRTVGNALELLYRVDWKDVPFVVEKSANLTNWREIAIWHPEPTEDPYIQLMHRLRNTERPGYFRTRVLEQMPRLLEPIEEHELNGIIERFERDHADSPETLESLLQNYVFPMFDLSMQIRSLTMELATADLDRWERAQRQILLQVQEGQRNQLRALVQSSQDLIDRPDQNPDGGVHPDDAAHPLDPAFVGDPVPGANGVHHGNGASAQ